MHELGDDESGDRLNVIYKQGTELLSKLLNDLHRGYFVLKSCCVHRDLKWLLHTLDLESHLRELASCCLVGLLFVVVLELCFLG